MEEGEWFCPFLKQSVKPSSNLAILTFQQLQGSAPNKISDLCEVAASRFFIAGTKLPSFTAWTWSFAAARRHRNRRKDQKCPNQDCSFYATFFHIGHVASSSYSDDYSRWLKFLPCLNSCNVCSLSMVTILAKEAGLNLDSYHNIAREQCSAEFQQVLFR